MEVIDASVVSIRSLLNSILYIFMHVLQEGNVEQFQRSDCRSDNHRLSPVCISDGRLHICQGFRTSHRDLHHAVSLLHLPNGQHHAERFYLPDGRLGN